MHSLFDNCIMQHIRDGVQYNTTDVPVIASNKDDLEIVNGTTWNENIVCTRDVITSGSYRVLLLQQPYGAIAQTPGWGAAFRASGTHTIYNAFEFLNSPGQFYFDKTAKTLYYYIRPGKNIGYIENGDYAVYNNINFGAGASSFQARVASGASGMHNVYLKFTGGSGYLFNLNWFQFTGGSATLTAVYPVWDTGDIKERGNKK